MIKEAKEMMVYLCIPNPKLFMKHTQNLILHSVIVHICYLVTVLRIDINDCEGDTSAESRKGEGIPEDVVPQLYMRYEKVDERIRPPT